MRVVSIIFLLFFCIVTYGQPEFPESLILSDHVYDGNIKTVQLYNVNWNLSYPFMKLNSNDKLALHFDLLQDMSEAYDYAFIHCDKDWIKSDIFTNDYTDGYPENPVEDYESSFNTTVKYVHYMVVFPNERVRIKMSGNYIIVVYPSGQPDKPVLTKRFVVTEDAVNINIDVHRPQMSADKDKQQQVDFTVAYPGQNYTDPYRNLYAFVLQNGRWDNAKTNLKPDFFGVNELKYNALSDKTVFMGGNEFRYFDIKSLRYQTEYIKGIEFINSSYNIFLYPSENREFKPYFYWQDFNGKYYIAIQEGQKYDIDADYVWVHFSLPSQQVIAGGDIYVSGALANWNFDENNRMIYNPQKSQYECTLLLKQGWYNYEYAYVRKGSGDGTASLFEGSHYETENDYNILVYYRNPNGRYDRVVGIVTFNTLNRISN